MARHRLVREAEGVALAANSAHGHDAAGEVVQLEPGSYRDRNGVVFYRDSRVFRGLSAKALANWERLSTAAFFREQIALGSIVATSRTLPQLEAQFGGDWAAVLEHARIPFVSYPYEWTFGMLKDAALLHLDLLEAALGAGMILKDSSAYNIQWRGTQPVFIDIPSFEVLRQGEPWVGYRQFCELFLYPLMMQAYRGVDFRPWLRGSIDGIPHLRCGHCCRLAIWLGPASSCTSWHRTLCSAAPTRSRPPLTTTGRKAADPYLMVRRQQSSKDRDPRTGRPGRGADAVSAESAGGALAGRAACGTAGRAPGRCDAGAHSGPGRDRDVLPPAPPWLSGPVHPRPGQARGPCDLCRPAKSAPPRPTSGHHPDAARSRHAAGHRPGSAPWPGRSGPSG